jgi:hypothetical protein
MSQIFTGGTNDMYFLNQEKWYHEKLADLGFKHARELSSLAFLDNLHLNHPGDTLLEKATQYLVQHEYGSWRPIAALSDEEKELFQQLSIWMWQQLVEFSTINAVAPLLEVMPEDCVNSYLERYSHIWFKSNPASNSTNPNSVEKMIRQPILAALAKRDDKWSDIPRSYLQTLYGQQV